MLQALAELLRAIVKPESDWGKFSRKIIGLLVSASIGATIWNVYFNYQLNRNAAEVSVGEVIERDPNKETVIRELLERIKGSNREIESVWLYSWPDARNLIPIMYVGDSLNPLPLGAFREGDEYPVGAFVLGSCTEIQRRVNNYSCPINGFEDAWGVLVVRYADGYKPTEWDRRDILATARRMGIILYSNDTHNGILN